MRTLNVGILAHVDAGKTSLTERLLYSVGVLDELGSVDAGSTLTDSSALERRRGITITSAVVSFVVGDVTVNLVDTPGHPDFIAEVERVLSILDGVVLVVSAVEGVQAQTRVLMRALQRLRLPTVVFVNKVDRAGADPERVLAEIGDRLTASVVALGSTRDAGTRGATYLPFGPQDRAHVARLVDVLSQHDDLVLEGYLDDDSGLPYPWLRERLASQTMHAMVSPVIFGSAITGAGVECLVSSLTELLPVLVADANADVTGSGTVFKIARGPAGERLAYVRMFSGSVRIRDRLRLPAGREPKVTAISVFEAGTAVPRSRIVAGEIGVLAGLGAVRIGDGFGSPRLPDATRQFAPPALETVVVPLGTQSSGRLHEALTRLAEQDPLIDVRRDDAREETIVSLYGEMQKEIIRDTLAAEFGVDVDFRESTPVCVERPIGSGSCVDPLRDGRSAESPFLAGIGLRVEPAPVGSGVRVRLEIERGSLPRAFLTAIEETVPRGLMEGLHGWPVTDCAVTITASGYAPRQSHAHSVFDRAMSSTADDFRNLVPLVLVSALEQAGTRVCEPIHRFHLEAPTESLGAVLGLLAELGASQDALVPQASDILVEGLMPARRIGRLQLSLPVLTSGEGLVECVPHSYRPFRGTIPTRPRTTPDPRDRAAYLLSVERRAQSGTTRGTARSVTMKSR